MVIRKNAGRFLLILAGPIELVHEHSHLQECRITASDFSRSPRKYPMIPTKLRGTTSFPRARRLLEVSNQMRIKTIHESMDSRFLDNAFCS